MFIKDVFFSKSITIKSKDIYFDNKKEIVFVGRSNVGKSSLMNSIFGKKDLVKTSSKPGKTREANLFTVNNKYYFTDLPGYGFAKLGKELKDDLDSLISWYLEERKKHIKLVVILVDCRIGTGEKDIEMYKYLLELNLPVLIVLSKVDKLNNSELSKSINSVNNDFFGQELVPVSSANKIGIDKLEKVFKIALNSDKNNF